MGQSKQAEHAGTQGKPEKIWTKDFIFICLANFFVFLGFQMTLPTLPLFVEELGGNDQLIGIVVGIFTFSALLLRPYAGHALETKGRRYVYLIGLAIFVLSVGSFGFAASLTLLLVIRIIQGIGWGFSTTASGTIATDIIPAKRRGEGMGYYGLSGNIALAFGPTLGLAFVGVLSFQQLFLICGALGLTALLLARNINYKKVEEQPVTEKRKWDVYEKSALQPSLLLFFITVTFGGIASFLPIYAAQSNVTGIEWYFLLYAVALLISRTFAGRLYDQKGHRAVFIPGALLIIAAMGLLAWLPNSLILYAAAVLYGLGFGTVQPALQAWSVKEAPANRRGMANATFFSFFDLGVGIGAITFGQVAHWLGYSSIYVVSAISVFISLLLYISFIVRKTA
ncbi:MFS transporter [Cytobacillus gottheilii]|uniref:MFS transporter n=1 Tax=Cytobacillus gottheilii TaxID=859144 RepID=A0ABX8F8Y4_9BACI|nr:MFS transporter [Cytobacillus gottheilii]QVY59936.1 MFS transporter [Cytobacillus gottheilii]